MPQIRIATADDAARITAQRHSMFTDNDIASEATLDAMDRNFELWVRERLADGRYVGLLLEQDGQCLAAAGIFYADFPPHFLDPEPLRPYLLNFYTSPEARGQGYAKLLLQAAVDHCRARGAKAVSLHASKFGKPIYERFGFTQNNEMLLRL